MRKCADCLHGTCMADGYCKCDPGYTGHADFLTQDFSDWGGGVISCPTSDPAVKWVWGFPLLMLVAVWYSCGVALYDQIKVHQELQWKGQAGRRFQSLPLLTMGSFSLVVCPSTFGLCLSKVVTSDSWMVIGATPLPSVMLATARLGVSVALPSHFHNAANLALKGNADEDELRIVFVTFIVTIWVVHIILGAAALTPLMQLARPPTDVDFNECLFKVFFAVPVGVFFVLSVSSLGIRYKLEKIFNRMLERHAELNTIGRGRTSITHSSILQSDMQGDTQRAVEENTRPESRGGPAPAPASARVFHSSQKQRKKPEERVDEYVRKLKRTRAKAIAAQTIIARQTGLLSLLYLLFLVVPDLKHHGTYLVAFHLQMYNIVGFKLTRLYMKSDPTWGMARRIRNCLCRPHAAVAPESSVTPFTERPSPEAESPRPKAGNLRPGLEIPRPGLEIPRPGAESPRPGAESPRPGAESPRPEVESPRSAVHHPSRIAEDHHRLDPSRSP